MNATNSLRWRARVTKEAFSHNDNDNSDYIDRWEVPWQAEANAEDTIHNPSRRRRMSTLLIDTLAIAAVGGSVYVILQWSLIGLQPSTHFLGRFLLGMACSLTCVLAGIVIQQERKQRGLGTLRQVYFATRRTVRSLQQQNERLCRTLTALDRTVDRMQIMEQELRQYTQSTDVSRSMQVVQTYTQIQRRLKEQLHYQIQEQLLCALLQHRNSNGSNNCLLFASDLERWIAQWKNMPGVVLLQEATLREILVSPEESGEKENDETRFTIPLENALSLLRQLRKDLHQNAPNTSTTPRTSSSQGGIWLDDDTAATTPLFQFQPRFLLPSTKDLMEF